MNVGPAVDVDAFEGVAATASKQIAVEGTIISKGDIVHIGQESVVVDAGLIVDSKPMVLGSLLVRTRAVTANASLFRREETALFPLHGVPRLQGLWSLEPDGAFLLVSSE